jgi:hypothetical protein
MHTYSTLVLFRSGGSQLAEDRLGQRTWRVSHILVLEYRDKMTARARAGQPAARSHTAPPPKTTTATITNQDQHPPPLHRDLQAVDK